MSKEICWIAHERYSDNASVNLLCFSYVGGSATYFAPLKSRIDSHINVCPVLYPGREKNIDVKEFESVREMAKSFTESNPHLFSKPFALLGHCTGALVAYEVALVAKKLYGVIPKAFFASSSPAPSCKQFWPDRELTDEELKNYLISNGMIDEEFTKNNIYSTYYLPLIRSDLRMFADYMPTEPYSMIDTPVNVLRGDSDVLFKDKKAVSEWGIFTSENVTENIFKGGHFYIDNHRREVGELITKKLLG